MHQVVQIKREANLTRHKRQILLAYMVFFRVDKSMCIDASLEYAS